MSKHKISELFYIEKGTLQSSKNVEGEFNFITASSEWKTHETYSHDCEALIYAMGASGSLGRTHYVNGKFISSDLCFILTPKDEYKGKLSLKFYYHYFNFFKEDIVRATATGTSKKAINLTNFSNYEIDYIENQEEILKKIEITLPKSEELNETNHRNVFLLNEMKEHILESAIMGQLLPQNEQDKPVRVLLEELEEEKNRLNEGKKIKKTKPLPEISEEEKSFALPQGWEWVRLGDICEKITDGTHQTPNYKESGAIFLSAQNVKPFRFMPDNHRYVSEEDYVEYTKNTKPEFGDVLLTRVGSNIGESAVIDQELDFAIYVSLGLIKPFKAVIDSNYLCLWLNSPDGTRKSLDNILGRGTSQGNLNLTLIRNFVVPLPPLEEQKRIVNKVNELLTIYNELQERVNDIHSKSENIMKAVLQESFKR